ALCALRGLVDPGRCAAEEASAGAAEVAWPGLTSSRWRHALPITTAPPTTTASAMIAALRVLTWSPQSGKARKHGAMIRHGALVLRNAGLEGKDVGRPGADLVQHVRRDEHVVDHALERDVRVFPGLRGRPGQERVGVWIVQEALEHVVLRRIGQLVVPVAG